MTSEDFDNYCRARYPAELIKWRLGQPPAWWRNTEEAQEYREKRAQAPWPINFAHVYAERHEAIALGLVAFFGRLAK